MRLVIFSVIIIGSLGAPAHHQTLSVNEDGTYQFSYETGNEGGSHFRTESKGPDGTVIGKYSYKNPTGALTVVNYRAGDAGFLAGEDGEVPQPSTSEPPKTSEEAVKAEDSEKDNSEKQMEEIKSSSTTEATEDEEKSLKLEEPVYDGPPEGFPPGFFSEEFSALRRLSEPKKEDKSDKKKDDGKTDESPTDVAESTGQDLYGQFSAGLQPEGFPPGFFLHHFTGLRRLEEPVKEQDSEQTIDDTKSDDPNSKAHTTAVQEINLAKEVLSSYILPFQSLTPQQWPASSHHHPVYVYSHQQPNAYSYGYYY